MSAWTIIPPPHHLTIPTMARISTWWLAAVALCTTAHAALTQFEYLQVAENLSKQFIFPNNIAQAESINSTLFSEDVVGTVDGELVVGWCANRALTDSDDQVSPPPDHTCFSAGY